MTTVWAVTVLTIGFRRYVTAKSYIIKCSISWCIAWWRTCPSKIRSPDILISDTFTNASNCRIPGRQRLLSLVQRHQLATCDTLLNGELSSQWICARLALMKIKSLSCHGYPTFTEAKERHMIQNNPGHVVERIHYRARDSTGPTGRIGSCLVSDWSTSTMRVESAQLK